MSDRLTAALVVLARYGIPPDIQELLVSGDAMRGIPPRALEAALFALTPAPVRAEGEALRQLKSRLDYRLNEHLCEMKPDYDDSITGFNEAWRIVDQAFADAALKAEDSL